MVGTPDTPKGVASKAWLPEARPPKAPFVC